MRRFAIACGVVAIATLGIDASAGAYPIAGDLVLSASSTAPGGQFTALFTDCDLGETVQFTVSGDSGTGTCTLGGAGSARGIAGPSRGSASTQLSSPRTPGTYAVTALGLTSGRSDTASINVVAGASGGGTGTGTGSDGLPATGSDSSLPILQLGAGALIAGLALSLVVYRRRSLTSAA